MCFTEYAGAEKKENNISIEICLYCLTVTNFFLDVDQNVKAIKKYVF